MTKPLWQQFVGMTSEQVAELLFGTEVRFFITCLVMSGLIVSIAWAAIIWALRQVRDEGTASFVFKVLFWIHQIMLGLPSVSIGLDLVI
jgi:hypothetical protein